MNGGQFIRVLVIEDSSADAELLALRIRSAGYSAEVHRVDTLEALALALETHCWDIILSDFRLPGFTGLQALDLLKRTGKDIPFILVSGSVGDEAAASAMKSGVHDFFLKDRVARLGSAIERELREAQVRRERKDAIVRLERANRDLQQFAYIASHDLRAPLRAIDSLSAWLEQDLDQLLKGEPREQMRLLRGRVRRMDRLLTDLLDYARAGQGEHLAEEVDVDELVSEAIALSNVPDGFVVERECQVPAFRTTRILLERAFLNLINNAIKHHDRSQGRVEISAHNRSEELEFVVSDDGPGIPAQFQTRIFQMFQTLKSRDSVEGSGMGLALVKKIVETAGGTITLESRGRGATFRFTWPKSAG